MSLKFHFVDQFLTISLCLLQIIQSGSQQLLINVQNQVRKCKLKVEKLQKKKIVISNALTNVCVCVMSTFGILHKEKKSRKNIKCHPIC
jgi:hypothetical protein